MASSESSHVTFPIPLTPTPRHLSNGATDTYTSAATMMALVHNSFTRGFNTVYHVAPKVPESDVRNFLQYADQLYLALKIHHTEEEEVVFPILEEALGEEGLMKVSVEEHETFAEPLKAYHTYITQCLASLDSPSSSPSTKFSASHLQSIILAFSKPLSTHLANEVNHLSTFTRFLTPSPSHKYSVEEYNSRYLAALKAAQKKAMSSYSLTESLPVFMLNHDSAFEGGVHGMFPPMPWILSVLVRRVLTWKKAAWWKYASCDAGQVVKPLPY